MLKWLMIFKIYLLNMASMYIIKLLNKNQEKGEEKFKLKGEWYNWQ